MSLAVCSPATERGTNIRNDKRFYNRVGQALSRSGTTLQYIVDPSILE